ncbi:MAG: metallophosphoesterase [Halobacteriota archaeon]
MAVNQVTLYTLTAHYSARERATMVKDLFIVMSDTHFGLDERNQPRFLSFLRWIHTTAEAHDGVLIPDITGTGRPLKAPRTIVLLGDILELWGPDREDFFASIKEAFGGFETLSRLGCETIYVSGNHDHLSSGLSGPYEGGTLTVCADHYPDDRNGVEIGGQHYFFVHGHQYAPPFNHRSMLKFLDFIGLAAWNSHDASPWLGRVGFTVLVLALVFPTPFLSLIGTMPWFLAPVVFVVSGFFATLGLAWGWRQLTKLWPLIHRLSSAGRALTTPEKNGPDRPPLKPTNFPRYTEYLATRRSSARGLSMDDLIDRGYYSDKRDPTTAENIVLGHTHVPGITCRDTNGTKKRFINDGSWVIGEGHEHDTFAYIDDQGPLLLQWDVDRQTVRLFKEGEC